MPVQTLAGEYAGFFIALITILGLVVGSFLNVVIHRVPKMLQNDWQRDCCELLEIDNKDSAGTYNLLKPDSHCPKCKSPIRAWQNIPIISYLFLKGRLNQCKDPISIRYTIVELCTGLLCGYIAYLYGHSEKTVEALFPPWALVSHTKIDVSP